MNQTKLDQRIIKISIDINGKRNTFSDLQMTATGTKYANAIQNECEITIDNLEKSLQNYILSETSPFNLNRTPKHVMVEAGRESYGTSKIYSGNIVSSHVSQPPDIKITLRCLTGNFNKGLIIARMQAGKASLYDVASGIAQDNQMALNFQAENKTISNYSYQGGALGQVGMLDQMGQVNAYVDNDTLVVKKAGAAIRGPTREVNLDNGMIGIPEITEQGIKVKYLLDNISQIGGGLRVKSVLYPTVNGEYVIYKLGFDIATRDEPFYYIAEAQRIL